MSAAPADGADYDALLTAWSESRARHLAAERRVGFLEAALIEATAELIYLRRYGKDGAVWWANESKEVWRGKAIAELVMNGGAR